MVDDGLLRVGGVDPSTSMNADAYAGTTPMPSPPPHRHKDPIGIPWPRPHRIAAGGRGGRICDRLRSADPHSDVVRGGVHGNWPNLVRGCGADGTRRGREGVSLKLSPIQGTPRRRPHGLEGMLKINAVSLAETLEGYPDLFVSALVGGGIGGGRRPRRREQGGGLG
jgi:hypothetical protein